MLLIKFIKHIPAVVALLCSVAAVGQNRMDYSVGAMGNGSTGDLAPYFIGSLNGGKIVRSSSALVDVKATVDIDRSKRFSWGAGVELVSGYSAANYYDRWDSEARQWTLQQNRPAAAWIQQLYGELKYRSLFMRIGQKDYTSALLDEELSSGDLTRSSNARGIPGIAAGFIDFQNIPFTKGAVQIAGELEYGFFTDDGFKRNHFNYYNSLLTNDIYYTYKRCFFRTDPTQPFSVTVGLQAGGQFGGKLQYYSGGKIIREVDRGFVFKDIWQMLFPMEGNSADGYYEGNTTGSWNVKARYRFRSGSELSFAFQGPWEDGSGIGRQNGFDGLWGLYFRSAKRSLISGVGIEYLDFRNQSGTMHWVPDAIPGTTITTHVSGSDNYYNNGMYASYSNYGLSMATPFLLAPIYNTDGYNSYRHNSAHGVHVALTGYVGNDFKYTLKYSWQQAWGHGRAPQIHPLIGTSALVAVRWDAHRLLPGLNIDAKVAFDAGGLRGDNFGAFLALTYSGNLVFKRD